MPGDSPRVWTPAEIRALGVTTDIETAGSIYTIGRTKSYELARAGEFPSPVIRVGAKYICPVKPILESLGIHDEEAAADPPKGPTATVHNLTAKSGGAQHAPDTA